MNFLKKLRKQNQERLKYIHDSSGSEFTELEWAACVAGECGEMCNLIKKVRRGSKKLTKNMVKEIGKEIADQILILKRTLIGQDADASTEIPEDKNVPKSIAAKAPVLDYSSNSRASIEIRRLAHHLTGKEFTAPAQGILGWLVGWMTR